MLCGVDRSVVDVSLIFLVDVSKSLAGEDVELLVRRYLLSVKVEQVSFGVLLRLRV